MGQPQNGVDIFGRPIYQQSWAGVQCKDKNATLGRTLKKIELETECKNACNFRPEIQTFSIATTAPRDESIQEQARELTNDRIFPFSVHVWSWDDIEPEILHRPALLSAYYPDAIASIANNTTVDPSVFSPRERFYGFFSRPSIKDLLGPRLREFLIPLAYELSDNSFRHGQATHFVIICDERQVQFEDDGVAFDPTVNLNPQKTSAQSHIGSFVLASFLRAFRGECRVKYSRASVGSNEVNRIVISFLKPVEHFGSPEVLNIPIDMSLAYGREGADRLAASITIPNGVKELILAGEIPAISPIVEFVVRMLERLPESTKMTTV